MKKMIIMLQLELVAVSVISIAQTGNNITVRQSAVAPQLLEISYAKTTHLIFPAAIKSVDRGSEDILVQKATGVENILKLKAAKMGFEETNLTVITGDGELYSFNVNFNSAPKNLTFTVKQGFNYSYNGSENKMPPPAAKAEFSNNADNQKQIQLYAAEAGMTKRNIRNVSDEAGEIKFSVAGLYTANDLFYYKLFVENNSGIRYDIEAIRFFIKDRKKVKRTATQETILQPIDIVGNKQTINAGDEQVLIAVLPKQTIARDKELIIEVDEKRGGRNLSCSMRNNSILKAKPISITPEAYGVLGISK